jgi:hypothetical protein
MKLAYKRRKLATESIYKPKIGALYRVQKHRAIVRKMTRRQRRDD